MERHRRLARHSRRRGERWDGCSAGSVTGRERDEAGAAAAARASAAGRGRRGERQRRRVCYCQGGGNGGGGSGDRSATFGRGRAEGRGDNPARERRGGSYEPDSVEIDGGQEAGNAISRPMRSRSHGRGGRSTSGGLAAAVSGRIGGDVHDGRQERAVGRCTLHINRVYVCGADRDEQ